ncbi:MAG: TonB-dependent receptor [Gemmatimonadetes bacterium]|nr:TonB-dependent receptor [Gemmatimonadota bacterium]
MKHAALAGAVALALSAPPLAAQVPPDTFRLAQLVVTATKLPSPRAAVPAHVTVLTGPALRADGYTRVVDALRDQAGIAVAQLGAPGAVASLFVRGGESDYVQVLVDGVQVNDPGGAYDWAHLTTADIERIEIVRGPVSVLYGSDAVSGVVQIFTRAGGRSRVEAVVGADIAERVGQGARGHFGSWHGSATASGGGAVARALSGGYGVSLDRQESAGAYAFNNAYGNTTVAARAGLEHARGTRLRAPARYPEQRYHFPTDGAGNITDRNRATYGDALAAGITLQQPLGERATAQLALGHYRGATGADDPEDEPGVGWSRSTGRVARDQLELRLHARPGASLTLSGGAELQRQQGRSTFASDGPFGPSASRTRDERRARALFAQLVRAGRTLAVTAGARLDDSDQFGTFAPARAGVSWQPARDLRAHAAWGTGFKEPTFLETYATGFARGNPALAPERSRSAELGLSAAARGTDVALTVFRQSFRNLIQYTFAPPLADAPNYFNMGGARALGIELELGATLPHGLRASGGYTGLRTAVTDAGFGEDRQFRQGEPLLRRPGHRLNAGFAWQGAAFVASLRGDYTGPRADLDFTDPAEWQGRRIELPAYATVAAALGFRRDISWGRLESTVRVRNLFDARYQEVYNFATPGRTLTFELRVAR